MTQTLRWNIAITKGGAEWHCFREILKKGFRCYYPHFIADAVRHRYIQGVIKPQFPNYLFVGLEEGESIEQVRSNLSGLRDFVRNGKALVVISDKQMARCRADCDQRYWDSLPRRIERMPVKVGDWIAVPHGAFAGLPAEVLAIDKSGRISASLGNLEVSFHITDVHGTALQSAKPAGNLFLKAS
jgi:transcription antitermination factor NusG